MSDREKFGHGRKRGTEAETERQTEKDMCCLELGKGNEGNRKKD